MSRRIPTGGPASTARFAAARGRCMHGGAAPQWLRGWAQCVDLPCLPFMLRHIKHSVRTSMLLMHRVRAAATWRCRSVLLFSASMPVVIASFTKIILTPVTPTSLWTKRLVF